MLACDRKLLIKSIRNRLKTFKKCYNEGNKAVKVFIKEWLDGITIDDDRFLNVKFDGNSMKVIDEETEKVIELKDMSDYELFYLDSELYDLLRELKECKHLLEKI